MKPYFLFDGITQLAKELSGNENIYMGIRPYGFHAGNQLAFMVYPYLLCEELEKYGKNAKFNFHIFLNDWEQDSLEGPDLKKYPFNVTPKNTTFQFLPSEEKDKSMVEYWEPIIVKNVKEALADFSNVSIIPVRNSQMKKFPLMKNVIINTIKNPKLIWETLKKHSGKQMTNSPCVYCTAICKECNSAKTETVVEESKILAHCLSCNSKNIGNYDSFEYWLYHKPLALPRIAHYNIDLCITGLDHYNEGDFISRKELFKVYGIDLKYPKILYTPTVLGADGNQMGKSKKNDIYIDFQNLLTIYKTQIDKQVIHI